MKTVLHKDVTLPLIRFSAFFKAIWSNVIDPTELDRLQIEIGETLCELEKIFPIAFFDIMVLLPIHLVEKIRICRPISSRCMYVIERYLRKLKSHVRNKCMVEGLMAEGYLIEKCITLCGRYLNRGVKNSTDSMAHPLRGRGRTQRKKCGDYRLILRHGLKCSPISSSIVILKRLRDTSSKIC